MYDIVKEGEERQKRETLIGTRGGMYLTDSDERAIILVQIIK